MKAVTVLSEVGGESLEQLRMGRLDVPSLGNLFRVLAGEIELVSGFDDAESHQLGPIEIYCCPGELRVAGQHACEFVARVNAGPRSLIGENELRKRRAAGAIVAYYAVALGVVTRRKVIHEEVAHDGFGTLDVRDIPRIAEEGRLLEKVSALLLAQVDIDLLEMGATVVASDARSEEHTSELQSRLH